MIRFGLTLVFTLVSGTMSLAQDACDDFWFVRNAVFDRNGYCFASPLGLQMFDAVNCTTKSPNFTQDELDIITQVKAAEARWNCRVDTTKTSLDIHSFDIRKTLEDQPLRDDTESGCINYTGKTVPLYAGHSLSSKIIGYLRTGSNFGNSHIGFDKVNSQGWTYVSSVSLDGTELPDIGWFYGADIWNKCAQIAG